ncbi:MAG: efflux RND transporter periplasmic adaptor subunit [Vicinamibacteria bacterium]
MNRRRIFWIAALSLGGFVVFRLYQELGGAEAGAGPGGLGGDPASLAQLVEATLPERSTLRERVSLIGSLRAKQRVDITPRVGGRLLELRVDRGDRVRAGQIVARIDDEELRQQVRRADAAQQVARASLAQREAELDNREMELERYSDLSADGVVSTQQLETARTNVQVTRAQMNLAEAQVLQADAELEELRIRLGQTEITSPLSGIVATRYVDAGAFLSSATPILLILDLSTMLTVVNVPERDINKMGVGTTARVTVDALAGEEFVGRVVRISPILDPQTRTAPVEIELENAGEHLKAEMFARVDLDLQTEREALLVPRDALVYRNDRQGVFIVDAMTARFQPVVTGLTDGDRVEILEGVTEQDTVVTRGANLLQNGDEIQILSPEGD